VNEQTKQQKKKEVEEAREMKENLRSLRKIIKKKSQIRWSPWQMLRPSGAAADLRVAFDV